MANLLIETEKNSAYTYFRAPPNGNLIFNVRASNDACLAFCFLPDIIECEIFIGKSDNTKSAIFRHTIKPCRSEYYTPDILNGEGFRGFWIKWNNGFFKVGRKGDVEPFILYDDPNPFEIHHVGIKTGEGASGIWNIEIEDDSEPGPSLFKIPLHWVRVENNELPSTAIVGGFEEEDLYIGRAKYRYQNTPGKIVQSEGVCYVSHGGAEHPILTYEVLCGNDGSFIEARGREIPRNAFPAGEENGVPLFIGRVNHDGATIIGKIHPQCGACYVPHDGEEIEFSNYEIFVCERDQLSNEEYSRMMNLRPLGSGGFASLRFNRF